MRTARKKADVTTAGQEARRKGGQAARRPKGKTLVLRKFPASHAGRPRIVPDMVGAPM